MIIITTTTKTKIFLKVTIMNTNYFSFHNVTNTKYEGSFLFIPFEIF